LLPITIKSKNPKIEDLSSENLATKTDSKQSASIVAGATTVSRGKSIRNVNINSGGSTVVSSHEQSYDQTPTVDIVLTPQQPQQHQQQQQTDVIMQKRIRVASHTAHKQPGNMQSQAESIHQAQQEVIPPQPTSASIQQQQQQKPVMGIEYTDLANFNTLATVAAAQSPNLSVSSPRHGKVSKKKVL
jgi:hypothetical protein